MARRRPQSAIAKLETTGSWETSRLNKKKLTETDILRITRKAGRQEGEDALPTRGMDGIRSQIRNAVSEMYRSAGSSGNAHTDADFHFAMSTLKAEAERTSNPKKAIGRAALDDELRSRDILNYDLQVEIQQLEAAMKKDEARHANIMSKLRTENWELGEKLREREKRNAMFTNALRSGGFDEAGGVKYNDNQGPELRTNVLHEAIRSVSVNDSFVRIVPPNPFFQHGEMRYDSNAVTAKISRLRRPSSARPPSVPRSAFASASRSAHRPGSAPLVREHESMGLSGAGDRSRASGRGDESMVSGAGALAAQGQPRQNGEKAQGATGGSAGAAVQEMEAARTAQNVGWLQTFGDLVDCYVRANAQRLASMSSRTEYMKRRALVHKEVEKLLCGLSAEVSFHDAVDALDQKTRAGLLDEVATEFTALGIFARTVHSMRRISESSFDMDQCFDLFTREVKELLSAEHVRLWLVDETNAQIWEWSRSDRVPSKRSFWASESPIEEHNMFTRKRTFVKAGIAADVARTGIPINVPFPAVQCQSFSIEIDRLPGENARTVICEPIRHENTIVAVTQCYNKAGDTEEAAFSVLDEQILRLLSEHVGGLWRKCETYDQTMAISEQTLNAMQLTTAFPCDFRDLYSVAQVHLNQTKDLVRAGHCVLYVYSPSTIPGQHKLWSLKPDGTGPRLEVEVGEGVVGWVAINRETVLIADPSEDCRFDIDVDAAFSGPDENGAPSDDYEVKNLLAVPIDNLDGSLLGVCIMLNKASGPFHQTDSQLLQIRCQQVAHMVKTNSADLSHFFGAETIFGVLNRCKRIVDADRGLFFVVDKPKKRLRMVADSLQEHMPWEASEAAGERSVQVPLTDGLLGYVARVGIGICVPDAHLDPRFNPELDKSLQYRTSSLLCLPVVDPDNDQLVVGVTLVTNKVGGSAFTAQDRVIATALSRQVGKLYRARQQSRQLRTARTASVVSSLAI